jgi:hypothetical protein
MSMECMALILLAGWSSVMVHLKVHYVWELCGSLTDCRLHVMTALCGSSGSFVVAFKMLLRVSSMIEMGGECGERIG